MKSFVLLTPNNDDWAAVTFPVLDPGAYVIVIADDKTASVARNTGFEIRDTIAILSSQPQRIALVLRKPLLATVAEQILTTETGAINIEDCRVGTSGGTKRNGQVPYPKKADGREDRTHSWARTGHDIIELDAGRWPPNLVLVHGTSCRKGECELNCLAANFGETFYFCPQFRDDSELLTWFTRLITAS